MDQPAHPATLSASQLSAAQRAQLLDAVSQPIKEVPRTKRYAQRQLGAMLVMLLVSAIYILLILAVAAFLVRCGLAIVSLKYTGILRLLFAGVPGFVALCVLLALIKPFFARAERGNEPLDLDPNHEPLLFEFVTRLCQTVGAPAPARISVDLDVNASAGHLGGLHGKQLRLTVGLPLVLGFNTRQFAGVLAHEFGHFRQVTGMKTAYVIRRVNQWLVHAAFERDAWDARLIEWSSQDPRWSWVAWLARGAVFVARLVLMGLIILSNFFCARLLREMEFEADRVETRLAGSQTFASTCRQLQLLGVCQGAAIEELDRYRRESRLPDNLPAIVVSNVARLKPEKFRELETKLLEVKTEWFDSHPADRDRIENAAREQAAGSFQLEWPATCLFSDFDGLSRVATLQLYRHVFGAEWRPENVQNTKQLLATKQIEIAQGEAALRFVLDQFCGYHTFHLPRFALGEAIDARQYKENARVRRQQLLNMVRGYALVRKQEEQLLEDLVKAAGAKRLFETGVNGAPPAAVFPARSLSEVQHRIQQLAQNEQRLHSELRPFRQMLGYRVMDALEFLRAEKVVRQTGEPPTVVQEVARVLPALEAVVRHRALFDALHFEHRVILIQMEVASQMEDERWIQAIRDAADRIHQTFTQIHSSTSEQLYPFAHGKGRVSLAYFLLPELPPRGDIAAICSAADDLEKNLDEFLKRAICRLGSLAEKVESVFGFAPLDIPAEVRRD